MNRLPCKFKSFAVLCVALSSGPVAPAANPIPLAPGFDSADFSITPDGSRIVFESYNGSANVLYSARTDGSGSPIPLSDGDAGIAFIFNSRISPDSARILFDNNEIIDSIWHVATYSSRLDGSSGPVLLNRSRIYDDDASQYNLAISPDSQRAIIRADAGDNSFDLFTRPIDGSAPSVMLNPGPHGTSMAGYNWKIAGNRVIFPMHQGSDYSLLSRPFDASTPAIQLTPDGQGLQLFDISRDASTVVFTTYGGPSAVTNVYSNSVQGGALTPLLISDDTHTYSVRELLIAPDGRDAIRLNEDFRLSTIKTDGSSSVKSLGPYLTGFEFRPAISPDGRHVAFLARAANNAPDELFISPIDGSSAPRKLSLPLPPGGSIDFFEFAPDGRHIVFFGDQRADGVYEAFSVLVDQTAAPVRLAAAGGQVTPDGSTFVYGTNPGGGSYLQSLLAVPIDGGQPVEIVQNPFPTGGINRWEFTPDGSAIIFTAVHGNISEIFAVAIPDPAFMSCAIPAILLFSRCRGRARCTSHSPAW